MAVPILMYHSISVAPRPGKLRSLCVPPAKFARQMRALAALGYRGVSMREAMPYIRGEARGKVAAITFDDGFRDNLVNAAPVLRSLGFAGTCYVVSGTLASENVWDPPEIARKPTMSRDDVRAWHDAGMEVGAHSHTHARLTQGGLSEIPTCKAVLEEIVQAPVTQFCYPYGALDDTVIAHVRNAGFEAATTIREGRARPSDDPFLLPRIFIGGPLLLPVFSLRVMTR